ncbi:hypothetical protein SAMN05216360_104144 [Methylobacterium phyllostachyos]|uniref:Uncharacterized protein n=1 Tax=Methylobacterium phyllostachyos TaxID=582672 RepID=A0A1G9WVG2_9HYPH|nr:hypothetical protein [Methylobacterium phyllostachyos]SDM88522.1 hypothetical protein SAMN05216360_104144 [Methylobacterium phyllostachyos]
MPAVQAYWNRTRRLWSVRAGGLVVAYEQTLALAGCRLHAGESTRLRCVRTGDRDVHAWIAGELADEACLEALVRIGYRPAETGFRRRDTDQIITRAELVRFAPDGSAWALNPR